MLDRYRRIDWRGRRFRRRLSRARRAAERQDRRHLHAAVAARRQAALPGAVPARLALSRARSRASRARAGQGVVRRQHPARASAATRWKSPAHDWPKRTLSIRPDPGGRGARDRDGDGGGAGQADAPADRDAAQAADPGGGTSVARSRVRPAARGRNQARGGQRPLPRRRARGAFEGAREGHRCHRVGRARPVDGNRRRAGEGARR